MLSASTSTDSRSGCHETYFESRLFKAIIGKMFGSHHPPAPKIFSKFSGNFGAEGLAFLKWLHNVLDDADVRHIFKDKGKLKRIIRNHPMAHVTFLFFFECSSFFANFVFVERTFYLLPGIAITTGDWWNQRKKTTEHKFDYHKKWTIAYYAPEISKFF